MTEIDDARREYADWYVREELARREVENARDAKYVFNNLVSMGIDPPMTADAMGYCCAVAGWLFAEAEHNRLHAEAVLRSHGASVL